ncbi:DUF3048 domain-containing protein [Rossellomorea sp. BNER]|uniref:DUF3048 domain-containing protein n=1 Tax=Rossellomorea sp. BNER TaxID=2962031 RepID=UPI003AF2B92B|nr:DUF3048 domain-containing protein [Rossellomorea sp. BNER]
MLKKAVMLSLVAFTLIGCGKEEKAEPSKEVTAPVTEEKNESEVESSYHFPLTGMDAEEAETSRAVAVVVNNHPKARPQSGLHKADIVYELLAEGDVTRFLAIFQSEMPKMVGPVRSARDYFVNLAEGYNGLFIAHGYSPEAKEMLTSGTVDHLNGMQYDGTLFKRVDFRKAPHNSYIRSEAILKGAEKNGYEMDTPPASLTFSENGGSMKGEEVDSIMVSYDNNPSFNVIYEYNNDKKKYERFSADKKTVDYDSKTPVELDNVLIIETPHKVIDNSGRREIDLMSGGNAYLLQKGKLFEVEWKNDDGKLLPYLDGEPVPLVPGKTWINIIPSNPGLEGSISKEIQ